MSEGQVYGKRLFAGTEMDFGTQVAGEPYGASPDVSVLFDGEKDDQNQMGELLRGITIVYAGALESGALVLQVIGKDASQLQAFAMDLAAQYVKKSPKMRSWADTGVDIKRAVPCFDAKHPDKAIGSKEYGAVPADQKSEPLLACIMIEFSGHRR